MKARHEASRTQSGRVPAAHATQRRKGNGSAARQDRPNRAVPQAAVQREIDAGSRQPIQRVRAKPTDEILKAAVAKCVSRDMGSCCSMSAKVHKLLAGHVDSVSETGAELMTWAENEGTEEFDIGNHTAATATWSEGTFVVDTTCGQFGGEDVYIGTVSNWRSYILGLQKAKISHETYESRSTPYDDMDMVLEAATLKKKIEPPKPTRRIVTSSTESKESKEVKKPAKEEPKQSGPKKSRCYLTTACVQHRGLDDDCRELTVLRAFRDGYLRRQPHGPALIGEYYRHAPRLVRAISGSPNANRIWEWIYRVIQECVRDIARGRPAQAEAAYRAMVAELSAAFPRRRTEARAPLSIGKAKP